MVGEEAKQYREHHSACTPHSGTYQLSYYMHTRQSQWLIFALCSLPVSHGATLKPQRHENLCILVNDFKSDVRFDPLGTLEAVVATEAAKMTHTSL